MEQEADGEVSDVNTVTGKGRRGGTSALERGAGRGWGSDLRQYCNRKGEERRDVSFRIWRRKSKGK
jgi:hypothetical protein